MEKLSVSDTKLFPVDFTNDHYKGANWHMDEANGKRR